MNHSTAESLKIYAANNPAVAGIDLWIFEGGGDTRRQYSNIQITITDTKADIYSPSPTITIPDIAAQKLMDALWEAGVKPSGGEGHTAHIRALNAHLEDMRRLVFNGKS